VTFDLRAPNDRDHGITELARDAAALLDRLGTGRAHVLGTSLGGFVAQELALARPDLVDRLVLISTSYGGRGGERMSARVLTAMFGVGSFSPEGAVRRGLKAATSARYRAEHPGEFDRIVGTASHSRRRSPLTYGRSERGPTSTPRAGSGTSKRRPS